MSLGHPVELSRMSVVPRRINQIFIDLLIQLLLRVRLWCRVTCTFPCISCVAIYRIILETLELIARNTSHF